MSAKLIMVQGTTSHSGKSVVATALCRVFAELGLKVAPFKAWNMSLNSYVTEDGLEIGRSQGIQAEAAGVKASGHMNPFLLKPEGGGNTQLICRGKVMAHRPSDFVGFAMPVIGHSLEYLRSRHDVVVIEGAGSPVEMNLREHDVANMRVARLVDAPVLVVADIDRGGALAGVVGTMDLLSSEERALVIGSVFNKFRGDASLLQPGLSIVEELTRRPVVGVIPYTDTGVADEDSAGLEEGRLGSLAADREHSLTKLAALVRHSLDIPYLFTCMGIRPDPCEVMPYG